MGDSRLFIVSNRLPVSLEFKPDKTIQLTPSTGGLVSAISGLDEKQKHLWFGWVGEEVPLRNRVDLEEQLYEKNCYPIYLNKTEIPGVPHVVVYRDLLVINEKLSIPVIKERKLLVDLVGGTQIGNWINNGYPLKNQ